ncbi:MAG: hypothetical protein NT051_05745, partial [Candidatus Micrarchaeota archaeon]|nr:hypothetical protein [Candidatus Micrarchaeota archaeon]
MKRKLFMVLAVLLAISLSFAVSGTLRTVTTVQSPNVQTVAPNLNLIFNNSSSGSGAAGINIGLLDNLLLSPQLEYVLQTGPYA